MTDARRILERLDRIYALGATRIGGSPQEDAAHLLAAQWLAEAGLEVSVDAAGNLFGRRGDPGVWVGSHLDSVPDGGRFDGALGVVAAIEAAALSSAPFAVVAFRDEERGFSEAAGPAPRRAACRPRSSSCTSSRAPCSSAPANRSAS